jgi:large subunit ribosomal protein L19e
MQLSKKKALAANVLNVGTGRIIFAESHLSEIKEAITRQDILDLHKSGAIQIREIKGRKKIEKRKNRRRVGKVKKKVNKSKKEYVTVTRKLRGFLKHLSKRNLVDKEKYRETRKMIRAKRFRSKRHLKETLEEEQ